MRRLVLVAAGVLLAFLSACCTVMLGLAAEAAMAPAGTSLALFDLAALILASLHHGTTAHLLAAGMQAIWLALVAVCFCPVCLVATVGEVAGLRGPVWASGATGAVTAAVPTAMRGALGLPVGGRPDETRMTILLFLTGVVAGLVLWVVAGRSRGAEATRP